MRFPLPQILGQRQNSELEVTEALKMRLEFISSVQKFKYYYIECIIP